LPPAPFRSCQPPTLQVVYRLNECVAQRVHRRNARPVPLTPCSTCILEQCPRVRQLTRFRHDPPEPAMNLAALAANFPSKRIPHSPGINTSGVRIRLYPARLDV